MSRDSSLSHYDNLNILLLTDGDPSPLTVPPGGIATALKDLMCEQPSRATISAFGFGYQMNSELLLQIGQAGNGAFAYIPDASMVGTVFCHAVSNALAMAHFNCSLLIAVRGVRDASLLQCSLPTERLLTDDGVIMRVPIGHLQPGQKRSLLCRLSLLSTSDDAPFSVQVKASFNALIPCRFNRPSHLPPQAVATCGGAAQPLTSCFDQLSSVAAAHGNNLDVTDDTARAEYLCAVIKAINEAAANPAAFFLEPNNLQFILQLGDALPTATPLCNALRSDVFPSSGEAVNEGELALAFSDAQTFKTWGCHYARSLVRAHQLQQCHNFKDPSVQLYCTAAFDKLRETADCMFVLLPPPREGRNKTWPGSGSSSDQRALLRQLPAERLALLDANPDDSEVGSERPCCIYKMAANCFLNLVPTAGNWRSRARGSGACCCCACKRSRLHDVIHGPIWRLF